MRGKKENILGLVESNASDGNGFGLDPKKRYTNLEMYLHYLVRDITASQNNGAQYIKL